MVLQSYFCLHAVKTDKKEDRRKREIKEQERRVICHSSRTIILYAYVVGGGGGGMATRLRKRVGQETVALPSETLKPPTLPLLHSMKL